MNVSDVQVVVGIGGWEHGVLDECFYPRTGMSPEEKLAFYAGYFETVEVRPAFWDDSLTGDDARRWIASVEGNRRFAFNVKLHSSFTHRLQISPCTARAVRGLLHPLLQHDRLGGLLAQFPYSFTSTSPHRLHLIKIAEIFRGFPLYVELRHNSWDQPQTRDLLAEHSLQPVSADLPRVRQLMPSLTWVLGDTAYLRLHGRNEKGWLLNGMEMRYDYLYNRRELRELLRRIQALAQKCSRIVLIANNTTGGKAVATALQLRGALNPTKHTAVPEPSRRAFPFLPEIAGDLAREEPLIPSVYRKVV